MKRLIIHIGYPKTATTTLQECLFTELHRANYLNYLGKNPKDDSEFLGRQITKKLAENGKIDTLKIQFYDNRLNLFSDEDLTMPDFYLSTELGYQYSDLPRSQIIKQNFINKVDDIKILVTIRAQTSLLYSYYVQAYKIYKSHSNVNTFDRFLNQILHDENDSTSCYFDYYHALTPYIEAFGKNNIAILLYEDYLHDTGKYIKDLSHLLGVDENHVQGLLNGKHLNKKEKTDSGVVRRIRKLNFTGKILHELKDKNIIPSAILNYKKKSEWFHQFIRFLTKDKTQAIISNITQGQTELIFQRYRAGNIKIMNLCNLNKEKLEKYGYI